MRKTVWISYDLGVKGDYESLYAWLDNHGAKECGESLAWFPYELPASSNLEETLREELKKTLEINNRTRIYIIYRDPDGKTVRGKFLFGGRRPPPWAGYGETANGVEDEA